MSIRVAAISYLNTLPFVYGLTNHSVSERIELLLTSPAESARLLTEGSVDIGIVPSVIIPRMDNARIISSYCIGAEGDVASVLLCSDVPLQDVETLYLDTESLTSVTLAKILCKKFWMIKPQFIKSNFSAAAPDYSKSYILIGDKAMESAGRFKYCYDLAGEWIKFRGLPFVFACWVANRKLSQEFKIEFNDALKYGLSHIAESLISMPHKFDYQTAYNYLTQNVSFDLTPEKRKGMGEFWCHSMEVRDVLTGDRD